MVKGTKDFTRFVNGISDDFVKQVLRELQKMDTKSGQVLSDNKKNKTFVATMNGRIRKILEKLGYFRSINDYIFNFNTLSRYIVWVQDRVNEIKIKSKLITPFRQFAISNVLRDLQGQGLDVSIIRPLQIEMRKAVRLGGNFNDMSDTIEAFLSGGKNGRLGRLAQVGSQDALGQFNGQVQDKIRQEFKLDAIRYVGSLVEDSRPQCERWVQLREFDFADLPAQIAWAERNGTGWIMGTTAGTFIQNRGGHACRHEAIPVRKKEDQDG